MRGKVGLFARKISSYFQLSHALTLSLLSSLLPCPSAFLHALTRSRLTLSLLSGVASRQARLILVEGGHFLAKKLF
ncbi:MAG: hypothetical protein BRC40_03005 [Cyanobacteria bacterium QH_8_48_120]|nr:MAG: hypothetical protein BRC34_17430 [Cyanobacteria bacterium QH_1_48_107]PSO57507.1 MAG: hypothetical protein BRC39_14760 [Cyanobacteria bacterium QH_7_48_89]PSO76558.1 MAG: hypothetical protein BRC40_03005 [Cyanobacteria bacterium QH_8_48_120]PSP06167.1 MAG: hypothetical protein BRC47_00545 [Cyanobacteria bacterium QS_7_48_42]